jgi:outer membrane protein assembly factor BamA
MIRRFANVMFLWLCFILSSAYAQTDTAVLIVERIDVIGQRYTRKSFIFRELNLRPGDKIRVSDLPAVLERNELRLLNSKVFNQVEITPDQYHDGQKISLCIEGNEPRYTDFVPLIELADRNFNVWWRDYELSPRRVNVGGYLKHNNLTGQGDPIRVLLQFGYTNKYEAIYRLPFANRAKTIGFEAQFLFSRSKEVNYGSRQNRQLFYFNPDQFQYFRRRAILQASYKPRNLDAVLFRLEYHFNSISDTIATELNPDFFGNGQQQQQYTAAAISYERDARDIKPYPLRGSLFRFEFKQSGIPYRDDVNLTAFSSTYRRYFSYTPKLSYEADMGGRITVFRRQPPFVNYRALGFFDNYVRGYEFYVMDGLDFALFKQSVRYRIWRKPLLTPKGTVLIKGFREHPLRAYLATSIDLGFVNDPYLRAENVLNNRPLMGYGIGVDFVYRYNTVIRVELSRNDLGQTGYYIHIGSKR